MKPSVSIVVPMHNGAASITEQLDGLDAAVCDLPGVEILVVDNRSTDGGAEIVRSWASAHRPALRLVPADEKAGEPYARNVGWRAADGEVILFCDADDVVAPAWARALTERLQDARYATGPLETARLNPPAIANLRGQRLFTSLPRLPQGIPFAHGCNLGFRRELLEELGGFDESYLIACDLEIAVRAHRHGVELAWAPEALVHYRLRSEPGEIYHQAGAYARSRRRIDRLLGGNGRPDLAQQARRIAWLVRHLPGTVHYGGRAQWTWVAGQVTGELGGRLPWSN